MSNCSKFGPIECKAYLTKNQNESRLRSKMKKCFLFFRLNRKDSQFNSGILKVKYHSAKNEIVISTIMDKFFFKFILRDKIHSFSNLWVID